MEFQEYEKLSQLEGSNWWYVARRNLISRFLPANQTRILDVGCGTGKTMQKLKQLGHKVIGIDIVKLSPEVRQQNALEMTFCEEFDIVLALDVFEHVDDKVLAEKIFRALKKNGVLILTVPAFSWLWSSHDVLCHHLRRYSKKDISRLLEDYGYEIHHISYWNFLLFFPSVVKKKLNKNNSESAESDLSKISRPLNWLFKKILNIENWIIGHGGSFPFGTSVFVVARKCSI